MSKFFNIASDDFAEVNTPVHLYTCVGITAAAALFYLEKKTSRTTFPIVALVSGALTAAVLYYRASDKQRRK
jgi:hypothetical protein